MLWIPVNFLIKFQEFFLKFGNFNKPSWNSIVKKLRITTPAKWIGVRILLALVHKSPRLQIFFNGIFRIFKILPGDELWRFFIKYTFFIKQRYHWQFVFESQIIIIFTIHYSRVHNASGRS